MTVFARKSLASFSAIMSFSLASLLAGCGAGPTPATVFQLGKISGVSHGGQNPIQGARVRLWVTNTTGVTPSASNSSGGGTAGYGVHAIQLATDQTVKTDSTGSFSFDPSGTTYGSYSCPAGQFAYITVASGNTGSGTANPNSVQLAVLGDCANLASVTALSQTRVFASELSTAAAAYALANFIGETNAGSGDPLVNINSPATNNAISSSTSYPTDGYCTTASGTTSACYAAGLSHAFATAAALVNTVLYNVTDSSLPTGLPNTTLPTNSAASIPQALIYTLGDLQASCTNTTGGTTTSTGSAGYNSMNNCTALFSDTTPPGTTNFPSDTLMAMVDLAKFPRGYSNTSSSVGRIWALTGGTGAPWPGLAASPVDFSLAILYTGVTAPLNGGASSLYSFASPLYFTLDANDNIYIPEKGTTTGNLVAMSPTGAGKWVVTSSTYTNPKWVAADGQGNVFLVNDSTSSSDGTAKIIGYGSSTGSVTQTVTADVYGWALAIDRANNLWMGRSSSASPSLEEYVQANSYAAATFTTAPAVSAYTEALGVDNDQNIWGCTTYTSGTSELYALPNSATSGTPTYTSSAVVTAPFTSSYQTCNGVSFDSTGNVWADAHLSTGQFFIEAPTRSGTSVTATKAVTSTSTNNSAPGNVAVDGSNIAWTGDASGASYVRATNSTGTTAATQALSPCYAPAGATTCLVTTSGAATGGWYDSQYIQVDSAGDVWVGYLETKSGTATPYTYGPGGILEILGTAAPTWGQLSWGHGGSKP